MNDIHELIVENERLKAEIETLSMAHDDMHRLLPKDKHALIKSNIALNRKVQELEMRIADDKHYVAEIMEQNKRYCKTLEYYADETIYDPQYKLDIMRDCGKMARKIIKEMET